MTEDSDNSRTLRINILPSIDVEEFKKSIQAALSAAGMDSSSGGSGKFDELMTEVKEIKAAVTGGKPPTQTTSISEKKDRGEDTPVVVVPKDNEDGGKKVKDDAKKERDEKDKKAEAARQLISTGINTLFTGVQKGFGIVQQIYAKVKQSSAFLQTVENLFNLAMTLLFLPLGNAIATVILPATIELVDGVLSLWDELDEIFDESGGSLGAILDAMLNKGLKYFADYFKEIATEIGKSNGIIGSIANLMMDIGEFIKNGLAPTLKGIFAGVGYVLNHIKGFISLYIGFKMAEATADMLGLVGKLTGAEGGYKAVAYSLIAGAVGGGAAYGTMSAIGMADGGYVPATDGGQLHILGEGGEGEYVIPESKLNRMRGGNITNNFYGYTTEELRYTVRDTIRDEITRSKYTGGF